jgi:hypothetical protein
MQTITVKLNDVLVYHNNVQAFDYTFSEVGTYSITFCDKGCIGYTVEYFINNRLCSQFNTETKKNFCFTKKASDKIDVRIFNQYANGIC